MKKFKRTKTYTEIIAQCRRQGVDVDDYNYRKLGADHIAIGVGMYDIKRPDGTPFVHAGHTPGRAYVMFNTVNGRFWGHTDRGIEFSSDSTRYEKEPWFQALLSFFYVEKAHG